MDQLRTRIDDWLETAPPPGAPDLDAAIGRGRRLRRARSVGWSAAALVAAVVVVAGAVALRPGHHDAVVPTRPRTEVRYPDGTVVAWPAPGHGSWAVEGLTQGATADVADAPGQERLRDDLLRSVPGSVSTSPISEGYQVGWNGRLAEYTAGVTIRRPGPKGVQFAFVSVRMTRGGVAVDGDDAFDVCGRWPGPLNLGGVSFLASKGGPLNLSCEVRPDDRVGSIVRAEEFQQDSAAPYRVRSAFTVRPGGTAVKVEVTGKPADLDAIRTPSSWQAMLDDLAATLPYPGDR